MSSQVGKVAKGKDLANMTTRKREMNKNAYDGIMTELNKKMMISRKIC